MLAGDVVAVLVPTYDTMDRLGNSVASYDVEPTYVENVLFEPSGLLSTGDVTQTNRPDGTASTVRFHFPKTYTASLRGCRISYGGHTYQVKDDPQPYMDALTPGPWNRPVLATEVLG